MTEIITITISFIGVVLAILSFISNNKNKKIENLKQAITNFKNSGYLITKSKDIWHCRADFKNIFDLIYEIINSKFSNIKILKSTLDNTILNLLILELNINKNDKFYKLLEKNEIFSTIFWFENPYRDLYNTETIKATPIMVTNIEFFKIYISKCIVDLNKNYPKIFGNNFEKIKKSYRIKE